jgi:hypothetical protein
MTTDIVIRSYRGDFPWLTHALKSINMRAKGFRDIHIIVPQGQADDLKHLTLEKLHECPVYADDYLGQQITKLMADTYTDADFILHFDSDTVFTREVTPETFMVGGKTIQYYEPYSKLSGCPWQTVVSEVLGWVPENEFMRRFPFVYPRWVYGQLRGFIEEKYSKTLEEFILERPYRSFSEFNVIGAYLWAMHHDKFEWRDPLGDPAYVRQFHSWDGIDAHIEEVERLLA